MVASEKMDIKRAGRVAILGRPNVGKSTLLNYLAGMELAIVSCKAQTTRHLIRAILRDEDCQIVFIDSPGIHESKHQLDRYMAKACSAAIAEADILVLMIDARFQPRVELIEKRVARQAKERALPLLLLLNKSDLADKDAMIPLLQTFFDELEPEAIIPISALKGEGVRAFLEEIKRVLPLSEALYSDDCFTDQSELGLSREIIRSEILYRMEDEIPHGCAVLIEKFEERVSSSGERSEIYLDALVVTDRENHKAMLLGKKGQRIKEIGVHARLRLESLLDCRVHLKLFVQVRKDWRQKMPLLKELGYSSEALLG